MKAESQLYFQKSQKLKAEAKFSKVISFSQKPKLNHLAAKHCSLFLFEFDGNRSVPNVWSCLDLGRGRKRRTNETRKQILRYNNACFEPVAEC